MTDYVARLSERLEARSHRVLTVGEGARRVLREIPEALFENVPDTDLDWLADRMIAHIWVARESSFLDPVLELSPLEWDASEIRDSELAAALLMLGTELAFSPSVPLHSRTLIRLCKDFPYFNGARAEAGYAGHATRTHAEAGHTVFGEDYDER